jgi:Nitrile hydratase beta subunit
VVDFETFRATLIEEIGAWEAEHGPSVGGYRYYERWLVALERTLLDEKLVDQSQVEAARAVLRHEWAHDHDRRAAGAREPDE